MLLAMKETLFLGVPFNAGQGQRGTAQAPAFFRQQAHDLFELGHWQDLGDIPAPPFRGRQAAIMHAQALSDAIQKLDLSSSFLALVGGDHGQGLGTVHGMLHHHPDLIVVWIDAHADANVPSSSPSGNMHGMPISWLLGAQEGAPWWLRKKLRPRQLLYVGARDLDPYERMLIEELDIGLITPAAARSSHLSSLIKRELARLDPGGQAPIHISLDVDALDAELVTSTGTRVGRGLSFEQIEETLQTLRDTRKVVSAEIVEINPELGSLAEATKLTSWARDMLMMLGKQRSREHAELAYESNLLPQQKHLARRLISHMPYQPGLLPSGS